MILVRYVAVIATRFFLHYF